MLLVTGITGHCGRYFLQELVRNKYEDTIRCVVRKSSNTSLLDSSGLKIDKVIGDLNDQEFIDEVMVGVDTVMHIYNINHSPYIVQAAIKNNVKRAILIHTTGIYSKFKNASQKYKDIEKHVLELGNRGHCETSITILRPTMIYGDMCDRNMSKFIRMIDKFRIIPVINHGNSLIQPVNARDLGKTFYTVLMAPAETAGKAFDLSGERAIKFVDAFKLISKGLNKNTVYISIPLGFGVFMGRILKIFTLNNVDYIEKIQRMGEDRSYSHEIASSDIGYNPMSFEDGIQLEVSEYLKNKII